MISIKRIYNYQDILDAEKEKDNGSYLKEKVVDSLAEEFHEKCYICENNEITKINIDHFTPHKGDLEIKFTYGNLFFCCAHCNGIKGSSEIAILNPTYDEVEDKLDYFIKFSNDKEFKSYVRIDYLVALVKAKNTAELLEKVYNGTTSLGKYESKALRKKIVRVVSDLMEDIALLMEDIALLREEEDFEEREKIERVIKNKLSKKKSFYGFRMTLVKIKAPNPLQD